VTRIDASESVILIQFIPEPPIDPLRIIQFIQGRKDTRLAGPDRLRIETKTNDARERAQRIREILGWLAKPADAASGSPSKKQKAKQRQERGEARP
jgi:transcription-repair coupling factor (superfamily II helicase)